MRIHLVLLVVLALLCLATAARADSRKGFVVGGGLGPGLALVDVDGGDGQSELGLSTDATIGYGLSDQLIVYGMSKIVWFSMNDDITFSEVAGVGATYFLKPQAPSLFVAGGGGWSVFRQPGGDVDTQLGFGALLGVGYEVRPHWLVQVDGGWNNPGDFQTTLVMLKVNYLYY